MGLGTFSEDSNSIGTHTKGETDERPLEEIPSDELDMHKDEHVEELTRRVKNESFMKEYSDDLGIIVDNPRGGEGFVEWGDEDVPYPLPEGYEDVTDEAFITENNYTKIFPCPHCSDDNLRQNHTGSGVKDSTWARCGGCSRILVDREPDEKKAEAERREQSDDNESQSGLGDWV